HFLTQIPQPMQRNSERKAILSVGLTSIQSLPAPHQHNPWKILINTPILTTGHDCDRAQLSGRSAMSFGLPSYIPARTASACSGWHQR
ncbi:hypothetical protein C8Q72DRAFT_779813, partial [Fomitopsis betulina]